MRKKESRHPLNAFKFMHLFNKCACCGKCFFYKQKLMKLTALDNIPIILDD